LKLSAVPDLFFPTGLLTLLSQWPYYYPRPLVAFSYILAICMGLAICKLDVLFAAYLIVLVDLIVHLFLLAGLCGWHYYLVSNTSKVRWTVGVLTDKDYFQLMTGQTTVEFYNNQYEKGLYKSQGEIFVSMYDFGWKENFKMFFNVNDTK
jgi:palmitoyltransferase